MPEGAISSRRPAPVGEGRWQAAGRVAVLVGDAVQGSEVVSGSPVIAAPCPQLQPAPGCPVPKESPAVDVSTATWVVHKGGFCTQNLLRSGMLPPASPKQFLPCHFQCPLGLLSQVYPRHLGGSERWHGGSRGDIESKQLQ